MRTTVAEHVRALLIDADVGARAGICEALGTALPDFEVRCVDSVEEGLLVLRSGPADVILLSSALARFDGPSVVHRLVEAGGVAPVIVLCDPGEDDEDTASLLHAGAQDTLPRGPFAEELLGRAIRHAMERQALVQLAEERLRRLEASESSFRAVAYGADGIAVLVGGQVQWSNPAAVELLGTDPSGGPLPMPVEGPGSQEVTLHRDRGAVTVEARASQTTWEGRSALLVSLRDVTGRRELAERVRKVQALSLVGRLAGGVAHDFNNILTGMLGNLDLLEDVVHGTSAQEQLSAVIEGAEQAARLTQRLLAFGHQQTVQPRPQELARVIHRVERWLHHLCGSDIVLELRIGEDVPPVEADPVELEQILFNLVGNARDAIDGAGRVVVSTSSETLDGIDCAVLRVADDGEGIPEAMRSQLFEPFVTSKEDSGGVGLGLPTVADIVERRGGRISFDSEPGAGTTFTIWLPGIEESSYSSDVSQPVSTDEGEIVLVVDDDQAIRQLLRAALEGAGYAVQVAPDGAEGLQRGRALGERLDLLVTDVMMPGLRGDELAAQLQEEFPGLRALLISGFAQSALNAGRELGATTAFLGKPFRTGDLLRRVRGLLDR